MFGLTNRLIIIIIVIIILVKFLCLSVCV